MSYGLEVLAGASVERAERRAAEPHCLLEHRFEHRLRIAR